MAQQYANTIKWNGPGYYYHNEEGWKLAADQNRTTQNSLRKYFQSKEKAIQFGLTILT